MVEDPDRLEAQRFSLAGSLDRVRPRVDGVPAVVLALPSLGGPSPRRPCVSVPRNLVGCAASVAPRCIRRAAYHRRHGDAAAVRPPGDSPSGSRGGPVRPAGSVGLHAPARASRWAAVVDDRDDRGRAGPRRAVLRRLGVVRRSSGVPGVGARLEVPGRETAAGRLSLAIRGALEKGEPVVVTGCGTSEHGAQAFAAIVGEAAARGGIRGAGQPGSVVAHQAFEASLAPQRGGLVMRIRHEGRESSGATFAALGCGRGGWGTDHSGDGPPVVADQAVRDRAGDGRRSDPGAGATRSIAVFTDPGGRRGGRGAHRRARGTRTRWRFGALLDAGLAQAARGRGDRRGAGRDARGDRGRVGRRPPGGSRELALKIEEASWLPTTARELETFLHGHLPAMDAQTGVVLILADRAGRRALARAQQGDGGRRSRGPSGRPRSWLRSWTATRRPSSCRPAGSWSRRQRASRVPSPPSSGRPRRSS